MFGATVVLITAKPTCWIVFKYDRLMWLKAVAGHILGTLVIYSLYKFFVFFTPQTRRDIISLLCRNSVADVAQDGALLLQVWMLWMSLRTYFLFHSISR